MGCGKSSVGEAISTLLCCPFVDLDSAIEKSSGRKISEIFKENGEAYFRQLEANTLSEILNTSEKAIRSETPDIVLSLGGGTVMTPACAELIKNRTICFYLKASVETLIAHLSDQINERPLLHTSDIESGDIISTLSDRIKKLMDSRASIYESTAHHAIYVDDKSIDNIAEEIVGITGFRRVREDL